MIQKLNRIRVEERLKASGLLVFNPREFKDFFGVSVNTASAFLKRNIKSGLFFKLRNGFYMLKDSSPSLYLIANKLYQPSYISLEKALSYYGIIPETVYTITSITTKSTREFMTPRATFSYQRIKKSVFSGYSPRKIEGVTVFIADPEKALADYLYFVDLGKISLNDRLNLGRVKKAKLLKFTLIFERPRMTELIKKIYAQYRKPGTIS
jgi:predicted transcriptional regulator of viral defense system